MSFSTSTTSTKHCRERIYGGCATARGQLRHCRAGSRQAREDARRIALTSARAYRLRLAELALVSPLEAWSARIDLQTEAAELFRGLCRQVAAAGKSRGGDEEDANFPHVARNRDGAWRIADRPPTIYHVEASSDFSGASRYCGDVRQLSWHA